VPARIRHLLSAESGCNDGMSFPFLYVGLGILTRANFSASLRKWFLGTLLWQCALGTVLGLLVGLVANRMLKFIDRKQFVGRPSYLVYYLLLAIFSVGLASTLGVDDFLTAFSAGAVFSRDGWFAEATRESNLASVIDSLLNSTISMYFGAIVL
jgi:sodium/hydrogen antiporter